MRVELRGEPRGTSHERTARVRAPFVLAGIDGGPTSDEILRQADRHAAAHRGSLLACRIITHRELRRAHAPADVLIEREQQALHARLTSAALECSSYAALATTGQPHAEIVRLARTYDAEMIVLGHREHPILERWFRRGTVDHVVNDVNTAVLVARDSPDTNRILVATDLIDLSFPTILAAARQRALFRAEVVALHCIDPAGSTVGLTWTSDWSAPPRLEGSLLHARDLLDLAIAHYELDAEPQVEIGAIGPTIVNAAEHVGADLVVIGMHRDTGHHGLIANHVVRRAPCSVLVVPMPPRESHVGMPETIANGARVT